MKNPTDPNDYDQSDIDRAEANKVKDDGDLADELWERASWLADRHRVRDAILMQRASRIIRAALSAKAPQ